MCIATDVIKTKINAGMLVQQVGNPWHSGQSPVVYPQQTAKQKRSDTTAVVARVTSPGEYKTSLPCSQHAVTAERLLAPSMHSRSNARSMLLGGPGHTAQLSLPNIKLGLVVASKLQHRKVGRCKLHLQSFGRICKGKMRSAMFGLALEHMPHDEAETKHFQLFENVTKTYHPGSSRPSGP